MAKEEAKKTPGDQKALDDLATWFPQGGEAVKRVTFAKGEYVGQEVLTGISVDSPHHKDHLKHSIMYYRGIEVRFIYKGHKVIIPLGAFGAVIPV